MIKKIGNLKRISFIFIMISLFTATFSVSACTVLAISSGATADGSVIAAQNLDNFSFPSNLFYYPPKDYLPGTMLEVESIPHTPDGVSMFHFEVPEGKLINQVEHTYGKFAGIMGIINERQVTIAVASIIGRADSRNSNGFFDIIKLTHLALERGSTAREAIEIIGDLVLEYGYNDTGQMVAICDPNEAWIFEIVGPGELWEQGCDAPGAYFVAQRVPDGHVAVCANDSVISNIDFSNQDDFIYGPGIVEFTTHMGWYDPASGREFNWKLDMCNNSSNHAYGARRAWRVFCLVAPSLESNLVESDLPFSVPVDKKLSITDISEILADHYEGTMYDMTNTLAAGPWNNPRRYHGILRWDFIDHLNKNVCSWQRSISVTTTAYSMISTCRKWLPDSIGGVLWYGPSPADTTCYVPIYAGMKSLSDSLGYKGGSRSRFTRESLYWAISTVATYADLKYSEIIKDIEVYRDEYYRKLVSFQPAIDTAALELYNEDPELARTFLTNLCNYNIESVKNAWWELLDALMLKYNLGFVMEKGRVTSVGYPESWINKVIVSGESDHFISYSFSDMLNR